MIDDTPVDVTDLIKRHRAERAYREEMSHATTERKWVPHIVKEGARYHVLSWDTHGRHCSEPNCEVNKPEETTERTCETYMDDGRTHDQFVKDQYDEPRPAAQEADELESCPFCGMKVERAGVGMIRHPAIGDCLMSGRLVIRSGWNRRPSRPMSAKVEKAIARIVRILSNFESYSDDHHWRLDACMAKDDLELIVAALKARG